MNTKEFIDDLNKLLDLLPEVIKKHLLGLNERKDLLEVVLDLGRVPEARYSDRVVLLGENVLSRNDLDLIIDRLGDFGADNRAGIERTLHRISAIRNRQQDIVGLTCRVGRAVYGTVAIVRDLIETGESLLLMGRPGVGKTTALREIARVMSDEMDLRVVIIDTSNEIAGDGDIPHPAIGRARRMQVSSPENQHRVMIEAVENHMPQVIVIDEIGTELEATAARTIAERGVQLIATAHGNSISNLIKNPTLSDLIGGVQSVTLGDDEARRRKTQKTVLERASDPTFSIAIEMNTRTKWFIHPNVSLTVDSLLRGQPSNPQHRELSIDGTFKLQSRSKLKDYLASGSELSKSKNTKVESIFSSDSSLNSSENIDVPESKKINIFSFAISSQTLQEVIDLKKLPLVLVDDLKDADVVLSLRNKLGQDQSFRKEIKLNQIPIYIIKSDTVYQIERAMRRLVKNTKGPQNSHDDAKIDCLKKENYIEALDECRLAIEQTVLPYGRPVELSPRSSRVLEMQSDLVARYSLKTDLFGQGDSQWLRVYPP